MASMLSRITDILLPRVETSQSASSDSWELSIEQSSLDRGESSASETDRILFHGSLPQSPRLSRASSNNLNQQSVRRHDHSSLLVHHDSSQGGCHRDPSEYKSQILELQPSSHPPSDSHSVTTLTASSSTVLTRALTGNRPRSPFKARIPLSRSLRGSISNFLSQGRRKRSVEDVDDNDRSIFDGARQKRFRQEEDVLRVQVESAQGSSTLKSSISNAKDEAECEKSFKLSVLVSGGSDETTQQDVDENVAPDSELEEGEIREEQPQRQATPSSLVPSQRHLEAPRHSSYLEALRNYRSPSPPPIIASKPSLLAVTIQRQISSPPTPRLAPPPPATEAKKVEDDTATSQTVSQQTKKKKKNRNKRKTETGNRGEEALTVKTEKGMKSEGKKTKTTATQRRRNRRERKNAELRAQLAASEVGEEKLDSSTTLQNDSDYTAARQSLSVATPLADLNDHIDQEYQLHSRQTEVLDAEENSPVRMKSLDVKKDNYSFEASISALQGSFSDEEQPSEVEEPQDVPQVNPLASDQPPPVRSTTIESELVCPPSPPILSPESPQRTLSPFQSPTSIIEEEELDGLESSELSDIKEEGEGEGVEPPADSEVSKEEEESTPSARSTGASVSRNSRSIHLDQAVERELRTVLSLTWSDTSVSTGIQSLVANRDNIFAAQGRSCSPMKAAEALETITSSKLSLVDKTAHRYLDHFAEYLAFCHLAHVSPFPITVDLTILFLYQHRIQNPDKPRRDRLRALRCFARCTISIFDPENVEEEYEPWKAKREMTMELENVVSKTSLSTTSSRNTTSSTTPSQVIAPQDNETSSSHPSSPASSSVANSTLHLDNSTARRQTARASSQPASFKAQPVRITQEADPLAPSVSAEDSFFATSRIITALHPREPSLALNNPPPRELVAFLSSLDPSLRSLAPLLHHTGYSTLDSLVELVLLTPSTRQRLYSEIKLREGRHVDSSLFEVFETKLFEGRNTGWV